MKKLALLALLVGGLTFGVGATTASAHGPIYAGPVYGPAYGPRYCRPAYPAYRPMYRPVYAPTHVAPGCGGVYLNTPRFGVGFGW